MPQAVRDSPALKLVAFTCKMKWIKTPALRVSSHNIQVCSHKADAAASRLSSIFYNDVTTTLNKGDVADSKKPAMINTQGLK